MKAVISTPCHSVYNSHSSFFYACEVERVVNMWKWLERCTKAPQPTRIRNFQRPFATLSWCQRYDMTTKYNRLSAETQHAHKKNRQGLRRLLGPKWRIRNKSRHVLASTPPPSHQWVSIKCSMNRKTVGRLQSFYRAAAARAAVQGCSLW